MSDQPAPPEPTRRRPAPPVPREGAYGVRMAPPLVARLVGTTLAALAVVIVVATVVLAFVHASLVVLLLVVLVCAAVVFAVAGWLRSVPVVHLDDDGYRVRLIRGAGVTQGAWTDVEGVAAEHPRDLPCLVLHLKHGAGTTTIPVEALDADRDDFARAVRARLERVSPESTDS